MANAEVVVVGPGELPLITELYNEIFRPPQTIEFFRRRFLGRYNILLLVANIEGRPVGFAAGFELKPSVFFSWLCGVHSDYRRSGVGAQLMEAMFAWAAEREYRYVRMECHNHHRPVLHMAIRSGFNIVGVRWDPDRGENLVICEKQIAD